MTIAFNKKIELNQWKALKYNVWATQEGKKIWPTYSIVIIYITVFLLLLLIYYYTYNIWLKIQHQNTNKQKTTIKINNIWNTQGKHEKEQNISNKNKQNS